MVDANAQEWVNVPQGAEITGYSQDYIRRLARNNSRLPEDQRVIKVRSRPNGYQIWLPDLMNYVATIGNGPLPKRNQPPDPDVIIPAPPPSPLDNPRASIREWGNVREWVNTAEAAEVTGYYDEHVRKLARENWKLPEDQRLIRVRRRSNRYDVWLPDLVNYITNHGYGPYPRNKS